jgi:effector-binding domain-containing protein
MEIKIENLQAQPAAAVKHTGVSMSGIADLCGEGYGKIMAYLAVQGKQMAGSPYLAYMNANEDWSKFDVELGIPVAEEMSEQDGIYMSKTCQGKAICVMYQGAYRNIESAYCALMEYAAENSLESTGIYYDYYINDPAAATESELLTKVVFPFK